MKKALVISLLTGFFLTFIYLNKDKLNNALIEGDRNIVVPTPIKRQIGEIKLYGWFAYWDERESFKNLTYAFPYLDIFSPMFYRISGAGELEQLRILNLRRILMEEEKYELPFIPVIGDDGSKEGVNKLLTDENIQSAFIDDLIAVSKKENYDGFAFDIEALKGKDEGNFSRFAQNVCQNLHENDLVCHLIVYGRTKAEKYDPAKAHDYAKLGQFADKIILMIYNYNNEFTNPGGQTPLNWYRRVLDYAVESAPREKIVVGLSSHGYRWSGNTVTGLTYPQVAEIISRIRPTITFNRDQSAKVFSVSESIQVWYEDAQSIEAKIRIAIDEYELSEFAIWRIGAEDPSIWPEIKRLEDSL